MRKRTHLIVVEEEDDAAFCNVVGMSASSLGAAAAAVQQPAQQQPTQPKDTSNYAEAISSAERPNTALSSDTDSVQGGAEDAATRKKNKNENTKKKKKKKKKKMKNDCDDREEENALVENQTKTRPVQASVSDSRATVSVAQRAAAQAAEFLAQLEQSMSVSLGVFAGLADPRGCTGFCGPRAQPCTRCGRMATVHQLRLQHRPTDLQHGPSLLGRTAWLLLRARASLTQLRSFAWCDELLRSAAECWAIATAPPGKGRKGKGSRSAAPNGAGMMNEHVAAAPLEVSRWWRQVAAGGGSEAPSAGMVDGGDGMDSVARLLCHIDETWFRLYYFTSTEAPAALAATHGGTGVPAFSEWMQRAVGATVSSAWSGGVAESVEWLEALAVKLESTAASDKGRSVDLEGSDAAAVLRRGCAAAAAGAGALSQPPQKLGLRAESDAGGINSGIKESLGNELLKIYDCMLVETQVMFRRDSQLAALGEAQWAGLTTANSAPCAETASHKLPDARLCIACASPMASSGGKRRKNSQQQASRTDRCSFCGGSACIPSCMATCVGCGKAVCIRCAVRSCIALSSCAACNARAAIDLSGLVSDCRPHRELQH
eukprot:COSAG02_NODE_4191_length_5645_cov_5.454922_4_plen_601_part_00